MQRIMNRRFAGIALILSLAVVAARAQTPQNPPPPKPPEPASRPPAEPLGMSTNIKLDFTITDQTAPGEPVRKIVTMVVADRGNGSIRSSANLRAQGRVQINVDVQPMMLQNGPIRLRLGLEYNPRTTNSESATESSSLHEQITVILEPGKPMIVSQAADPASDRKILVEVRATVMK